MLQAARLRPLCHTVRVLLRRFGGKLAMLVLRMVLALDRPTSAEGLTEPSTTVDTQPYFEGSFCFHRSRVAEC
jgi:hypothetical protein